MTKWQIKKIMFAISMLLISSALYSTYLAFVVLVEIALKHGENTLRFMVIGVITYIACFVTLIIGLQTLDGIKEKIINEGNNEDH